MIEIALIAAVSAMLFLPKLRYDYVSDDSRVSEKQKKQCGLLERVYREFIGHDYYNIVRVHIMSITVHTAVCVAIYYVLGRDIVSFTAAMLVLVNSANSEISVWISGRLYGFAVLLTLAGMLNQFVFPFAWVFSLIFLPATALAPLLTGYPWHIVLIVAVLLVTLLHPSMQNRIRNVYVNPERLRIAPQKLILACKTIAYYVITALYPVNLGFFHDIGAGTGLHPEYTKRDYRLSAMFWVGLGIVALIVWAQYSPYHRLAYGLAWFFLGILPVSNIVSVTQNIALRYAYFANIGLMYAVASVVPFPWSLLIIGVYYGRTLGYMKNYQNELTLQMGNIIEQFDCQRAWHARGVAKFSQKDYTGAANCFRHQAQLVPWDFRANINAGTACMILYEYDLAEGYFKAAEANYYNNNRLDEQKGVVAQAWQSLEFAKQGQPFRYSIVR
jgi:hypothetical protein